jgi:hypothetical protein
MYRGTRRIVKIYTSHLLLSPARRIVACLPVSIPRRHCPPRCCRLLHHHRHWPAPSRWPRVALRTAAVGLRSAGPIAPNCCRSPPPPSPITSVDPDVPPQAVGAILCPTPVSGPHSITGSAIQSEIYRI